MIRIQRKDFNSGEELKKLTSDNTNIGGLASFIGLMRNSSDGADLISMTLEHYPGMTEKMLKKIENQALNKWPLEKSLIIHRYGRLKPGEQIVMVAAASAHRHSAIEACTFLIDWLKTKAPFWKLEELADGETTKWVEARQSDTDASNQWDY
mgnify:CR=1 FL=1|tara:strand:- start:19 stop:474 length:456 start_codon:yes stop_codon:yes gene_type:complete